MSDISLDFQLLEEIASNYYQGLADFEYLTVECLKRCQCVTRRQRSYITGLYPGRRFVEFLEEFPELFFVENDRVAQFNSSLNHNRQSAVEYFEAILNNQYFVRPVGIVNLRGHVGQADDSVINFVNTFYPGEEFKRFLQSKSDVFVVFEDDTAWSASNECVRFYRELLTEMGEGTYYYHLLMNSARALPHTKAFLQNNYPGEKFLDFLEENPDQFQVDEIGFVTFGGNVSDDSEDECDSSSGYDNYDADEDDDSGYAYNNYYDVKADDDEDDDDYYETEEEAAADFFHAKLKACSYYPHFLKLRNYKSQAPKRIKEFVDANYPGKAFKRFLLSQPHHFIVSDDGTVSLTEEECVSFLEERLKDLGEGSHYATLHIHVGQAHLNVRDYMRDAYPDDDAFRRFLESHPERFYLDEDGCVFSCDEGDGSSSDGIETKAAEYFKQFLIRDDYAPHYMSLRGHIGQASEDVIDYINDFFPNVEFQSFLLNLPEFFVVNQDGTVCSTENEAVAYFENILDEMGGQIYWYNLQLHLLQAPPCLKAFFQNNYPGEKFEDFFSDHQDEFSVDGDELISLAPDSED